MLPQLELVSRMGMALLQIQQTEKVLNLCITYFLPGQSASALMIEAEEVADRKTTLGTLMRKLRQRIDIDPDFDDVLAEFVEARNTFTHDLHRLPGFNVKDDSGIKFGIEYVKKLTEQAVHVRRVLSGLASVISGVPVLESSDDAELTEMYKLTALMAFKPKPN